METRIPEAIGRSIRSPVTTMNAPRRHHYVAQMFQRRFADEKGVLFAYDKRRPERGVFGTKPGNLFVERDLNTVELKDGTVHFGLEEWYSELEGDVSPIIDKIIASAARSRLPGLTADERNTWDNFVYHQQKRAPDAFERLGLTQQFEENVDLYIAEYEREVRPLTAEERADLKSQGALERMKQQATVTARGAGSEEVIAVLAQRGIAVAVMEKQNKSFILGDYPISRMGPHSHLARTELWLPVSSKVAVSPHGNPGTELLIRPTRGDVRRVNKTIFQESNVVAACSNLLVKSLVGKRR